MTSGPGSFPELWPDYSFTHSGSCPNVARGAGYAFFASGIKRCCQQYTHRGERESESDSKKERQQGTARDKQIERKTEGERKSLNIYFDFVIG